MNPFKLNKTVLVALLLFCLMAVLFFQYLETLI
jgi:hypothetical protein